MAQMKIQGNGERPGYEPLDGSELSRPVDLPKKNYAAVAVAMVLALVVGAICLNGFLNTVVFGAENQQKEMEAQLNRGVSLDLPLLSDYATKDNDAISKALSKAGFVIYDNSTEEDAKANGFDYYNIPSDVTLESSSPVFADGLESADAVTLGTYLPGTWRMLMNRSDGVEVKLRYADFAASTPNAAIANAIASQGFNANKAGSIEQDSAGNYAQSGTTKIGKKTYYWTISTCDLSKVYDCNALPENAQYVGITLRKG